MTARLEDVASKAFDYVIIGGGSAGLCLAARLSEDPDRTVCVLEAGDANLDDPNLLRPGTFGSQLGNKLYDWGHMTVEQKHLHNRPMAWGRGRGLGGSSAINFMLWNKPPKDEIDDIEQLGNPGWDWKNYQKYLARTEGYVDPPDSIKSMCDLPDITEIGRDGPLPISYPCNISEADIYLHKTMLNAGLPVASRPHEGDPDGVFWAPNTHDPKTHTRSYATTAFYLPNVHRPNLTVLTGARANRVLIEAQHDDVKATGVEFVYNHTAYSTHAKLEVILSCGALGSPKLLELSGIGKRCILEDIGVPVNVDLPGVGENMQEHIMCGISWELKEEVDFLTFDELRTPARFAEQLELYESGQGLFTLGVGNMAFFPLHRISQDAERIYQDAKAAIDAMDPTSLLPGLLEQYETQLRRMDPGSSDIPNCELIGFPGHLSRPKPPVDGKKYITVDFGWNNTFSRGYSHVKSNDPAQEPEIEPRYLDQDVDLQVCVEIAKYVRKLVTYPPLNGIIVKEQNPGAECQTDAELREWVKQTLTTTWHTAATCSMLPREKNGVVDTDLKVYGTTNLRIVDLSILPLLHSAHTLTSAYAIAEQAADIIKARPVS